MRREEGSLEWRIRRQLLFGLLAVMALLLAVVHISVTHLTRNFIVNGLDAEAENLIAVLERDAQGGWQLNNDGLAQAYQRVHSGHYFRLVSETASFRSRSLWDYEPVIEVHSSGQKSVQVMSGIGDQHWLVVQRGFIRQGELFTLWLAEDIAELRQRQWRFEFSLLVLFGLSIPALLLLQKRVLKRGFARLEPLRKVLAQQQAGETVDLPGDVPDEVAPLVASITQLLHQSGEQISRSRMAVGNLAHELKRPLQQLQWLADQHPDPEQGEQLMLLYRELHQKVERELRRARIAGTPGPGRQFVPREEVPHIVRLLQRIGRSDLDLSAELPDGAMPFDRDDMLELVGNLLDNAWRHASSRVQLRVKAPSADNPLWSLCVEDDGPGVEDQHLEVLAERGMRIDETSGEGSGLGLSLCRSIVESYNGRLEFRHADAGGLQVCVLLAPPA
ncbi:sensor histidine kinase [Marinobacterium sediminicola]|uniref:histidine kinase n=1 Tax=Marinobacterium sediminicola TaxID=518898 RepID=A0ABY1RXB9_9GAMM|nr:sensor histidine kinase [Marinobacterium sediminicola]ULG67801.1 sensor histidine kinase [Marinobacterium sediminicola]SMR71523.1 Signal transduction histidine kinase [Marinobacterium sediminicola]